jgi:hypothetical protein
MLTLRERQMNKLGRLISRCRAIIAEETAADPTLPWPLRDASYGEPRLRRRIHDVLLEAGPEFGDLLDRFERVKLVRGATASESMWTDDGEEVVTEHQYAVFQVSGIRKAIKLMLVACRRLKTTPGNDAVSSGGRSRSASAAPRQSQATKTSRTKPGPKGRDHAFIADIVARYDPWKDHLDDICEDLDKAGVPIPKNWRKTWTDAPRMWEDALDSPGTEAESGTKYSNGRSNVIKSLENSIKKADQATPR